MRRRITVVGAVAVTAGVALWPAAAWAARSVATTENLSVTAGSLSVSNPTPNTITAPVGAVGTGDLPSALFSDTTGSGNGWNGTVAVSDFTYTGTWAQTAGTATALATSSSGAFTGTCDGVSYTVTVGSGGTSSSTPVSWSVSQPAASSGCTPDSPNSGSGTATNGTAFAVGNHGASITFASGTTYPQGAVYVLDAGTMTGPLVLDTAAAGAGVTPQPGTSSPAPTLANNGVTVTGGGVGTYGTAVKMVTTITTGVGMGSYTVVPGASLTPDNNSWVATYVANVQYTIVTGP
ncbi:MAG TPA: hypothetical protein VKV25_09565 [Acidimicrobiales bacterium]|nr:hypothetical protein [Acidimicrobiales bacterium]